MTEVLIRHRETGVEYAIQSGDFKRGKYSALADGTPATYEAAGFEIVHEHPSGIPYEAPEPRQRVVKDDEAPTATADAK